MLCYGAFHGEVIAKAGRAKGWRLHNLHGPREQDEERDISVFWRKQDLARLDMPHLANLPNSIDLSCGQNWKSLCARIERAGYQRSGHSRLSGVQE